MIISLVGLFDSVQCFADDHLRLCRPASQERRAAPARQHLFPLPALELYEQRDLADLRDQGRRPQPAFYLLPKYAPALIDSLSNDAHFCLHTDLLVHEAPIQRPLPLPCQHPTNRRLLRKHYSAHSSWHSSLRSEHLQLRIAA